MKLKVKLEGFVLIDGEMLDKITVDENKKSRGDDTEECIREAAEMFKSGGLKLSKVRIQVVDTEDGDVMLDTSVTRSINNMIRKVVK